MDISLLKKMAMADGVLSEKEKKVFRENTELSETELEKMFADIEEDLESVQLETEVIDWKKKNGLDFEKYIVSLLPNRYNNLRWTGDKFIEGRFDEHNLNPDIIFDLRLNKSYTVAIECKFRKSFYKNGVSVARKKQLERYKQFQKENNIPVFIAIGVGGSGTHPEELYIVPVNALKFPVAQREYLSAFSKKVGTKLFYDTQQLKLR